MRPVIIFREELGRMQGLSSAPEVQKMRASSQWGAGAPSNRVVLVRAQLSRTYKDRPSARCLNAKSMKESNTVVVLGRLDGNLALIKSENANILMKTFEDCFRLPYNNNMKVISTGKPLELPRSRKACKYLQHEYTMEELSRLNKFNVAGPEEMRPAIVRPLVELLAVPHAVLQYLHRVC